jgi:hypothetical protein
MSRLPDSARTTVGGIGAPVTRSSVTVTIGPSCRKWYAGEWLCVYMWMPKSLTLIWLSAVHFSPETVHGEMFRLLALVGSPPVPMYGMPRIAANSSSVRSRSSSLADMVRPGRLGPNHVLGMKPWLAIASRPNSSRNALTGRRRRTRPCPSTQATRKA